MRKKGYIILLSIILLGILLGIVSYAIENYLENKLEKHVIEEYGFEISYSKKYKDISVSGDNTSEILSNITTEVSGEEISEYMQNVNFTEVVKELKNEKDRIKLSVEALNIEKTALSLEEICNRYIVMFRIYNEERSILEKNTEIITIDGKEVGRVTIKIKGENEHTILRAYLLSLEDKEITVTFITPESAFTKNEKQINKIIKSLKVY